MGLAIENITTQDDYVAANTFGQGTPLVSGWFIVANAVAAVRLTTGIHGQPSRQEEVLCPPGIYPIQSNPKNPITTIEFRSFVAGSPAQIIGAVFYPSDSFIQSGGSFDAQISSGGGVTPPGASINGGSVAVTFPGAALSTALVVPHGLGVTPATIQLTHRADLGVVIDFFVTAFTANDFTVQGRATAALGPGAVDVFWLAFAS